MYHARRQRRLVDSSAPPGKSPEGSGWKGEPSSCITQRTLLPSNWTDGMYGENQGTQNVLAQLLLEQHLMDVECFLQIDLTSSNHINSQLQEASNRRRNG